MIVTIDGPAGAGKSTLARALADRLGFHFLDTGAMYRAVALLARRSDLKPDDEPGLLAALQNARFELTDDGISLNGEDVGRAIRSPEVTNFVRHVADMAGVRDYLTRLQRAVAEDKVDVVTEGRDQGTVVFPNARCKFFLTASPETRAKRRLADFQSQGHHATYEQVLADQIARDSRDQSRELAPLKPADDACHVDSSELSVDQVLDLLEKTVRERQFS